MTDDQVTRLLLFYNRLLSRGEHYSVVYDLKKALPPNRKQQAKMDTFLKQNQDQFARLCAGAAFTGQSIIVRMALAAMFRFFKLPYPTRLFPTFEEGVAWCNEQYRAQDRSEVV